MLFDRIGRFLKTPTAATIALVALAFFFRIKWAIGKSEIYGDEFWQLSIMKGSFWDMLSAVQMHEHCGFLSGDYLIIYPFFKMFGYSRWGLAFPHLVITLIGFYFLYLLAGRYLKSTWGYFIAFLIVAFNGTLIEHSVEARTYAVLPTLAVMSLYYSEILMEKNIHLSSAKRIGLCLFFIFLIWFYIYGIVIFFCTALFSFLSRARERSLKEVLSFDVKFLGTILLIAMPLWFYSVLGPHLPHSAVEVKIRQMNTFDYISNPLVHPVGFLKSILGNLVGYKKFYPLLLGALAPFVLPLEQRQKQIGFFLTLVALPLLILLLGVLQGGYWFLQRQFAWVVPFFALYLGWCWESSLGYAFSLKNKKG